MGIFDIFRRPKEVPSVVSDGTEQRMNGEVAFDPNAAPTITFNNPVIQSRGFVRNRISYETILSNKELYIYDQFAQSDYYVDADPIYRGLIKQVYTPFSIADPWKLIGANEEVKQKYEKYYEKIRLREKMESIFYQYHKYANVYIYQFSDGRLITLPPEYIRIANIAVDFEPMLEFDCTKLLTNLGLQRNNLSAENYLKDSDINLKLAGYPPEIADGVRNGKKFVQLNPHNTFTFQDTKEDWMRYAIPMIAACLLPLKKKSIISDWEDSNLKLGTRSFLHVKYGDPDGEVRPNKEQQTKVFETFKRAMQGTALAVTNSWATAEFKQPDQDEIFHFDKYNSVNAQILSAGGISEIIVSGQTTTSATFATAQVSMQTAAIRIRKARDKFCEIMNKINERLNERGFTAIPHRAPDQIPQFTFPPVDLAGTKQFQEICTKLYDKGVISKKTLLQTHGFDIDQEVERRKEEKRNGTDEVLVDPSLVEASPSDNTTESQNNVQENREGYEAYRRNGKVYYRRSRTRNNDSDEDNPRGRPTEGYNERTSDPAKSQTGRQPKPSNPSGSEAQT